MRKIVALAVCFSACKGTVGPQGPQGETGPAGRDGASVTVGFLDAGSRCPEGGALVGDQDGGVAICNGTKGDPGPQGLTGLTVPVFDRLGREVGPLLSQVYGTAAYAVWVSGSKCSLLVRFDSGANGPLESLLEIPVIPSAYESTDCSGSALLPRSNTLATAPIGCWMNSPSSTTMYRVRQPFVMRNVTLRSILSAGTCAALGTEDVTRAYDLDEIAIPDIEGPFTIGPP